MTDFSRTLEQRRAGAKYLYVLMPIGGFERRLFLRYRAFTHKIHDIVFLWPVRYRVYPNILAYLGLPHGNQKLTRRAKLSIHTCPYIYSQRDSTHIFTVEAPTLFPVSPHKSPILPPPTAAPYVHFSQNSSPSTVIPPTFLPFFGTLCCRALNHTTTVTVPTERNRSTVLSPTKTRGNPSNLQPSSSGKDVLKTCIKKTSRLMMSFLIFFSSERRAFTS